MAVYQWQVLPNSPAAGTLESGARTDDIWFFTEQHGWLVNSSGYVCETTDGGTCWQPKFYLCPSKAGKPYMRCMGWGSEQVGWFGSITGEHTDQLAHNKAYLDILLHHTTDGGNSWHPVKVPEGSPPGDLRLLRRQ